jgi:vacuolar-type H+-ATPase subunit I/STV1
MNGITSNPTLINGFEDIITHIKNQEQRIMSLEEEHKQVKKENDELKEEKVKWESLWFNQNQWCNELTEKVDKLTDENYELKEDKKTIGKMVMVDNHLQEDNVKLQETLIEYLATIEGLYKQIEQA